MVNVPEQVAVGWRRAYNILTGNSTEMGELFTALVAVLWGAGILNPWTSTFAGNPITFRVMESIAEERVWGAVLLALGLTQLWALLYWHRRLREWNALLGFALWLFLVSVFWLATPTTTSVYIYVPLALLQLRTFLWLRWVNRHAR